MVATATPSRRSVSRYWRARALRTNLTSGSVAPDEVPKDAVSSATIAGALKHFPGKRPAASFPRRRVGVKIFLAHRSR
jgi:hypothetical protein